MYVFVKCMNSCLLFLKKLKFIHFSKYLPNPKVLDLVGSESESYFLIRTWLDLNPNLNFKLGFSLTRIRISILKF